MNRKKILWAAFSLLLTAFILLQFVPAPPLQVPALLPQEQRSAHRLLAFESISNFRDLGGYRGAQGKAVKWGILYRSGHLADATNGDLENLSKLGLKTLIDFRSSAEKAAEPDRLPDTPTFNVVEIPILDSGNNALVSEVKARVESGDFDDFDPNLVMAEANRQFATDFTPQFRQFINAVMAAQGQPVLWHCTAGKDRTGFAAAIVLRLLGVDDDTIMADYMASRAPSLAARQHQLMMLRVFKGQEAADKLAVIMGVEPSWLRAAFTEIDRRWGDFDHYVRQGLQLSPADIARLRTTLLQ